MQRVEKRIGARTARARAKDKGLDDPVCLNLRIDSLTRSIPNPIRDQRPGRCMRRVVVLTAGTWTGLSSNGIYVV